MRVRYRTEAGAREALQEGARYGCSPECSFCQAARAFLADDAEADREALLASRPETD